MSLYGFIRPVCFTNLFIILRNSMSLHVITEWLHTHIYYKDKTFLLLQTYLLVLTGDSEGAPGLPDDSPRRGWQWSLGRERPASSEGGWVPLQVEQWLRSMLRLANRCKVKN